MDKIRILRDLDLLLKIGHRELKEICRAVLEIFRKALKDKN